MVDIVCLILYLISELANYILGYAVIFDMEIEKKRKKWLFGCSIILLIHIFALFMLDSSVSRAMSLFTMLIVPIFFIEGTLKKRLALYPIISMGFSSIAVGCTYILGVILNIPEHKVVASEVLVLFCQYIPIIIMLVTKAYRHIKGYDRIQIKMDIKQYILFYVGIVCAFFILSTIQTMSKEGVTEDVLEYYGIYASIACVVMIILIIWQGIFSKKELEYKKQKEMYNLYMEMQESHIKNIIEQDERMRRFRHDLNKHFIALSGYASEGNNKNISEYLDQMIINSSIDDIKEYTGNRAVDAIIRQIESETHEKNINFEARTSKLKCENIMVFDLCTIVSNLLKNAVEACEKIEMQEDKKIQFTFCNYESHIYICVKNTILEKVVMENDELVTTKNDKKEHGYGSGNVYRTVKKYEGDLNYKCDDNWFEAEIIL